MTESWIEPEEREIIESVSIGFEKGRVIHGSESPAADRHVGDDAGRMMDVEEVDPEVLGTAHEETAGSPSDLYEVDDCDEDYAVGEGPGLAILDDDDDVGDTAEGNANGDLDDDVDVDVHEGQVLGDEDEEELVNEGIVDSVDIPGGPAPVKKASSRQDANASKANVADGDAVEEHAQHVDEDDDRVTNGGDLAQGEDSAFAADRREANLASEAQAASAPEDDVDIADKDDPADALPEDEHPEAVVVPSSDGIIVGGESVTPEVHTVPDSDAPAGPSSPPHAVPDSDGIVTLDADMKPLPPTPQRRLVKCKAREPAVLKPMFRPPVTAAVENQWVCLFFRFCVERHKMYNRRKAGVPRDKLTEDETMKSIHIGNVFRQLDPSSIMIRDTIIGVGDQSHVEVCFRIFLYCMFYNEDTWKILCDVAGGVPSWKNFEADMPAMERALYERTSAGHKIYLGGFQLVPPTVYFTDDRNRSKSMHNFAASLRLVLAMMKAGLPDKLLACKYAVDASYVLQTIPTLGGFLSLNILCFLNDTTHFHWPYRNFATCGPGSRYCMQRMFGKEVINSVAMEEAGLLWLAENQYKYYARLGLDPPHEWENGLRPGMRVLDIENALCWCHRYIAAIEKKGLRSFADEPLPEYDPAVEVCAGPPAWVVEDKWRHSSSRATWDAEHKEEDDRLFEVDDQEDVYEVEMIVARKGTRPVVPAVNYHPTDKRKHEDQRDNTNMPGAADLFKDVERQEDAEKAEDGENGDDAQPREDADMADDADEDTGDGDGENEEKDKKPLHPAARGLFRVRWKGWTPEEDTWESAWSLLDGADEALQEWLDWEDAVWGAIEDVKCNKPYKKLGVRERKPQKPQVKHEAPVVPHTTREERAAKRARRSS